MRSSTLAGASGLYVVRPEGTGLRRVQGLTRRAAAYLYPVRWAPDGTKVADDRYAAEECSPSTPFALRLTISSVDERLATEVALLRRAATYKAIEFVGWSPDGTKLLYIVYDAGYNEGDPTQCRFHRPTTSLATVGADGKGQRTLIGGAYIYGAAWSADGRRIAYVDCLAAITSCELGLIRSDGIGPRAVLDHHVPEEQGQRLVWTPKGNEVLVNLDRVEGDSDTLLFAVNVRTRRRRLLFQDHAYVYGFSRDGSAVIGSRGELLAVPLSGKTPTRLGSPPVPKGFEWGSDSLYLPQSASS